MFVLMLGCATLPAEQDPWLGEDKAKHFFASAVIAGGTTAIALNQDVSDGEAIAIALPFTLSLGVGKEAYDSEVKGTGWSWRDLAWDLFGAVVGGLVVLEID